MDLTVEKSMPSAQDCFRLPNCHHFTPARIIFRQDSELMQSSSSDKHCMGCNHLECIQPLLRVVNHWHHSIEPKYRLYNLMLLLPPPSSAKNTILLHLGPLVHQDPQKNRRCFFVNGYYIMIPLVISY